MEYYMQFAAISLEGIAAILGVCVAALGVYVANRVFTVYRLQQRSEAAAKALVVVNGFINYIKEIRAKQGLYENRDYYPDRIPEIPLEDQKSDWVRPFRLIFNETNKFGEGFGEAIIKIAGKEFVRLNEILDEIKRLAKELSNLLPQKIDDRQHSNQMLGEWKSKQQDLFEKIDTIRKEAECMFLSIIDGKNGKS
jgi:hypothetical protein